MDSLPARLGELTLPRLTLELNRTDRTGVGGVEFIEQVRPEVNADDVGGDGLERDDKTFLFDPVPEFDIWYCDNVFYQARIDADWDRDGTNDDHTSAAVETYFRQAIAKHIATINQITPKLMVMGNVDGQPALHRGFLRDPEYRGKLPGAFLESAMGQSFSTETWSTWENMFQSYRDLLDNTAEPHLVILNVKATRTDYAAMRYGLTTTLLQDGYFSINEGNYRDVLWYDEFDLQLGRAIDPPQAAPWQAGVYRRRFENGMVLINPKGNTMRTLAIEPGYRRFAGTQDPVTNNGQPVTTVTLPPRDGLVLVTDATGGRPIFATQPAAQAVAEGSTVVFRAESPSAERYQWQHDGVAIPGATGALLVVPRVAAAGAGAYTCVATNAMGTTTSAVAMLSIVPGAQRARLVNVALLVDLAASEGDFTLGAALGGEGAQGARPLLVRAAGPSLTALGVASPVPDPQLRVFGGSTMLGLNNDWGGSAALTAAFRDAGAFAFSSATSKDAALTMANLSTGSYTVQVSDATGRGGSVLAEIYATGDNTAGATTPRLVNLSALKRIAAGSALTAGFVIGGEMPVTVLVRAVGPSLTPLGVTGVLSDPRLELYAGSRVLATNDDWLRDAQLAGVAQSVGAFALNDAGGKDAALVITLPPGNYSARVSGSAGSSGQALVEVYEVP